MLWKKQYINVNVYLVFMEILTLTVTKVFDICVLARQDFSNSIYDFYSDCGCSNTGSTGQTCKGNGKCDCKPNYIGVKCDECRFGYFQYPECQSK